MHDDDNDDAITFELFSCVISGFCRDVNEIFALLECYAAYNGNYLPTFRDNLSCLTLECGTMKCQNILKWGSIRSCSEGWLIKPLWGKKGRQCTYKHTYKRVRVTNVAVESNKYYVFSVCGCSRSYPARKSHFSASHYTAIWLCCIFPHYVTNGTIFGKNYWT